MGLAGDVACAVAQPPAFLLVGQQHLGAGHLDDCADLLYEDVAEEQLTFCIDSARLQLVYVDARDGVLSPAFRQLEFQTVFAGLVNVQLQVGRHVQVPYVKESPLRLSGILAWLVVVGLVVQSADGCVVVLSLAAHLQLVDGRGAVHGAFLQLGYPLRLKVLDGDIVLVAVRFLDCGSFQQAVILVVGHVYVGQLDVADVERHLLLPFILLVRCGFLVFFECVDDELVVGGHAVGLFGQPCL